MTAAGAPALAAVAIETATETVGVAVRAPDGVEAEFALTGRRRHVETLTPALEHVLDQVGVAPQDLQVIVVDIGPGLFTGLRVGVAAAKGLAQALGLGVVCATSLETLGAGAAATGHSGLVLACVDARRGEVFASVRELDHGGATVAGPVPPGLFAPADLAAVLERVWWRAPLGRGGRGAALRRGAHDGAGSRGRGAGARLPSALGVAPSRTGTPRARRIASRRCIGRSSLYA